MAAKGKDKKGMQIDVMFSLVVIMTGIVYEFESAKLRNANKPWRDEYTASDPAADTSQDCKTSG